MTKRIIGSVLAVLAALPIAGAPASAHHSNVAFAVETVLTATGTVKEWQWSNPHTWLIMDVDDGKGGKAEWAMEGRAPGVLLRAGWSRSVLKAGDKVTVHYSPSKDGSKVGMIARVTMADGKVLPNAPPGD
jgi:hypothetical protein